MLTMSAHIALRVRNGRRGNDTWSAAYISDFIHTPAGIHGLGASTDGETFSGDCYATGGDSWQSLVITDTPYDSVWWYVKAPGDTSGLGTQVETDQGDGVERHATMTYTFPEDVGEPLAEGAYYEITAYVYRWDLTVYWDSYQVWVRNKNSDSLTL